MSLPHFYFFQTLGFPKCIIYRKNERTKIQIGSKISVKGFGDASNEQILDDASAVILHSHSLQTRDGLADHVIDSSSLYFFLLLLDLLLDVLGLGLAPLAVESTRKLLAELTDHVTGLALGHPCLMGF